MQRARWRHWKIVVTALLIASVLCFATLETLLRFLRPLASKQNLYELSFYSPRGEKISRLNGPLKLALSPFTVYENLPNQHTSQFNINSMGLRGQEIGAEAKDCRILVLGGSTAFGYGAKSEAATFHAMLERAWPQCEVLNGGVVGFLSGQELVYLVTKGLDFKPSVVLVLNGWNDLHGSLAGFARKETELGFNVSFFEIAHTLQWHYEANSTITSGLLRFIHILIGKSFVLDKLRNGWVRLFDPAAQEQYPESAKADDFFRAITATYVKNMVKMHQWCSLYGIKFCVVIQPELGSKKNLTEEESMLLEQGRAASVSYQEFFPARYDRFRQEATALMAQAGVSVLDLDQDARFISSPKTLFIDVVHLNEEGNQAIADSLLQNLPTIVPSSLIKPVH